MQADEDMTKSSDLDATYSGTTACMTLVNDGHVYTANVGDSGACLGRLGPNGRIQAVELSKYAKPSDPQVWLSASLAQLHGKEWMKYTHVCICGTVELNAAGRMV